MGPDCSDFSFDGNRKTPPQMVVSHLYPRGSSNPGKLNPDLVHKIASGIRKQPVSALFLIYRQSQHSNPMVFEWYADAMITHLYFLRYHLVSSKWYQLFTVIAYAGFSANLSKSVFIVFCAIYKPCCANSKSSL